MAEQCFLMELPQEEMEQVENIFQENLLHYMNLRNVQLVDIHRETGIAIQTLWDWCKGYVTWPMFSPDIITLSEFLGIKPEQLIIKGEV